jgi:hypothetical protein
MTAIAQTNIKAGGVVEIEPTTLTASDTFTYQSGANQYLVIENTTASAVTPSVTGSAASSALFIPTYGTIDISGAYGLGAIPAGEFQITPLDSIRLRLAGVATLTGCVGCKAMIIASEAAPTQENLWIQSGKLIAGGVLTVDSKLWG